MRREVANHGLMGTACILFNEGSCGMVALWSTSLGVLAPEQKVVGLIPVQGFMFPINIQFKEVMHFLMLLI